MSINNIFPTEELKARVGYLKIGIPTYPLYRKQVIKNYNNNPLLEKIVLITLLRIEREGVYYLIRSKLEHLLNINPQEVIKTSILEDLMIEFHREIYKQYILYEVDLTLKDIYGEPLVTLDKDQRSEAERLTQELI